MSRHSCLFVLLLVSSLNLMPGSESSAIPIWELLTHEEKMGRLFYVFVHLVEQYCKTSDIPDCPKVLTLYGMSNLVSESEHSLDLMDPYQRDAKTIVWERIMRGEFKLPSKFSSGSKPGNGASKPVLNNDVYSSPYEVRVRPPTAFVPSVAQQPAANDGQEETKNDESSVRNEEESKLTILRLRRSDRPYPVKQVADNDGDDDGSVPVLSEQEARTLGRIFQ